MASKKNGWVHTDYLNSVFNPRQLKATIAWCVRAVATLKKRGIKFDTLAFTGTSGAAVGFAVGAATGTPVTFIRKPQRSHFHGGDIEGMLGTKTYVFIDDFISSGATYRRVQKKMGKSKCVGAILYVGSNKSKLTGVLTRSQVISRI